MKYSLCIPTMNRYDTFLKSYLEKYIHYGSVDEIIITDETGDDIDKINRDFSDEKLILIKNEEKLGPFLNKLKACKHAKNDWIALIDSDNFVDENYFKIADNYIAQNNLQLQTNVILAPFKANPNFDYSSFAGLIIKKENLKKCYNTSPSNLIVLMNTGNYIINKYLIQNLDISNEINDIAISPACDVIYFNTLMFEQLDLNLHVVPGLEYLHVIHPASIYLQTHTLYSDFNNRVYERLFS